MEKIYTIDAHSHFGIDAFFPNIGQIDEYDSFASKIGIDEVYAMPTGCPVITEHSKKIILSYYEQTSHGIEYYKVTESNGHKEYTPNIKGQNPYAIANDKLYELCQKNHHIKYHYVPLIHPQFYSIDDFILHINRGARIFKLHGIACGIDPRLINPEFFKILETLNIPLLIHTDYSKEDNILSLNSSYNWLSVLSKYNIKVYIAHATRLNRYSIDLVNSDSRYVIGLGPDLMLNIPGLNEITPDNYLEYILKEFDENKIIFDIDYPWNTCGVNDYSLDWLSKKRLCDIIKDKEIKRKVLSKNLKRFIGGTK